MEEIIITEKLSKQYKETLAVSEISLNVRKGEIYGFLGLNGAGKTTTIRMLLGMISPTSGVAYIDGKKVFANNRDLWKDIGYLVEVPYSYPNLTVRENLEIIRRLHFLPDKAEVDTIIEKLQLTSYADRRVKNLSLGNAQRLGLAKALIHKPKILILDEPTNGLDPAGIHEIREFLKDMTENHGVTVFISSHILGEISKVATRIGIIHQGKLMQEIDTSQLNNLCKKRLLIDAHNHEVVISLLNKSGYSVQNTDEGHLACINEEAILHPEKIATLLVNAHCPPTHLQVEEENLESYFLRTIGMEGGIL